MNKLLLFMLFSAAFSGLFAQQDFYVVDSLYCYVHNGGVAAPTERQYNLSFSPTGEALESRREKYQPATGQWENLAFLTYQYDNAGNQIQRTEQQWDTIANLWVNAKRSVFSPNQNGDYTHELNEVWDGQAWKNLDQINSIYSSNGTIELLTQQVWENGAWRNNLRIIYASNAEGRFVLTKFQLWSMTTNSFYDVNRQTYSYDPQNPALEIKQLTEVYNQFEMRWDSSSQLLKAYDSQGNLTEQVTQLWSAVDSTWTNTSRIFQNFNAENDVTLRTEFVWNGSQWVNFFQVNNVYDTAANLTKFEVSEWDVTQWKMLSNCDFYPRFHHEVLAANEPLPMPCAWPNPYRLGTPVQCPHFAEGDAKQMAVYDFSGKLWHLQNVENQSIITMDADLPTGIYVVKISGEAGYFAPQKLMIIK